MNITDFLSKLSGVKKTSHGWQARCPAHDDHKASLSITEGKDSRILLKCFAGCSTESIVGAKGLKLADLFAEKPKRNGQPKLILAAYPYHDETGKVLFETVRFEPKDFKQRRPDPQTQGKWIWNLDGVPRVLYRLVELKAAIASRQTIYIAAGEKDVDALVEHGFAATCNPLGEKSDGSSWLADYTETLRGAARVVVIADKDATGRAHARFVATAVRAVVSSLNLIELPDRDERKVKDPHDFFAAGGAADELWAIVEAAPQFTNTPDPQATKADSATNEYFDGDGGNDNPGEDDDSDKPARKSAATRLVKFAEDFAFFHDSQGRAFVRLDINGHLEVWPLYSTQFRNLLAQAFWKRTHKAINRNALTDAVATLAGKACFDSTEEPVFLRVAPHGENILIDLCDPQWRVVEVTPNGWRTLDKSPAAFIRTGAMRALPVPAAQGSLEPLWQLLNVTPAQRPLVGGALLNYFRPDGPFFVTNFVGEQGTAKSCAAKMTRQIIDPHETPLRSPPREERDLLVQAASNWCVALDNLSALPPWLSDGLCRLSTGGGHSARSLYTDAEEYTLSVKRPVILNGIEDVAVRPDLAERALQLELEPIPDHRRISERELWREFDSARPVIFSAVLDGLVCALRELPNLRMDSRPRMADAVEWATAGETALGWPQGTFAAAYHQNLSDGANASVEAHPVGFAIRELLDGKNEWSGEPTQLLRALNESVSDELKHARNWPQNARALTASLRRLAQALRRSGIALDFSRGRRRAIRLCRPGNFASPASPASPDNVVDDANDANLQPLHHETKLVEEVI